MNPDAQDSRTGVEGMDPWGLRQVEQLLSGLEGVGSLKIVPDGHGGIDEVHVVSSSSIGAKQIVRNIESALLAEFGLQIDHRKISVAQLSRPDIGRSGPQAAQGSATSGVVPVAQSEPAPERHVERRLLLDSLELERTAGHQVSCNVTLKGGEESYRGTADGPDFSQSRLEVAARAVLGALNQATMDEVKLRLEGITRFEAFGRPLLVVLIKGQERRQSVSLSGVTLITDSPEEAAVLACLQATNRWAAT